MLPSQWTSTYNFQFRDANTRLISPHQGESMYHYSGHYDPSHSQRQHGFYARRALAAASTTTTALAQQQQKQQQQQQQRAQSANPYTNRDSQSLAATIPVNANNAAFLPSSSPPPPHSARASAPPAFRNTGYASLASTLPLHHQQQQQQPQPLLLLPVLYTPRNNKDLWTHPILPHTGVSSDYTNIPGIHSRPLGNADFGEYERSSSSSSSLSQSQQQQREPGYHVPGYQGFVRGFQFTHAETYGKTTRKCLDVPTDVPLE